MAVFRIEKTRDYTVMSNHHLRNAGLSLKSKGLLSMMLSLPEDWNYTTRGLAKICKEGTDSIGSALKELERAGYIVRNRIRDSKGKIVDVEYVIYETPHPPDTGQPCEDEPDTACPDTENPDMDTQMKTVILYNIISLIIIFVLIFVLRIVSKSDLRKNQQLIIKVITTILIVCVIAFVLFIDAIAVGIIGPVPN